MQHELLVQKGISLSVLRLDKIHPVISGNKLFKLHYFIESIDDNKVPEIITFGGAYSNHLVATAYACKLKQLPCTGIVRGEKPVKLSHTLEQCLEYGMALQFISREEYDKKESPDFIEAIQEQFEDSIIIPEGGFAPLGAKGAAIIMDKVSATATHICCAVGTATTLAGLLMNAKPGQQIIGFPVLKGMTDLQERIDFLTGFVDQTQLLVQDQYHFGGYAKKTSILIDFMNTFYKDCAIPTDFVYTAKMMYGVMNMIQQDYFPAGSNITCIHTGGLQGNLSLPTGILTFN